MVNSEGEKGDFRARIIALRARETEQKPDKRLEDGSPDKRAGIEYIVCMLFALLPDRDDRFTAIRENEGQTNRPRCWMVSDFAGFALLWNGSADSDDP